MTTLDLGLQGLEIARESIPVAGAFVGIRALTDAAIDPMTEFIRSATNQNVSITDRPRFDALLSGAQTAIAVIGLQLIRAGETCGSSCDPMLKAKADEMRGFLAEKYQTASEVLSAMPKSADTDQPWHHKIRDRLAGITSDDFDALLGGLTRLVEVWGVYAGLKEAAQWVHQKMRPQAPTPPSVGQTTIHVEINATAPEAGLEKLNQAVSRQIACSRVDEQQDHDLPPNCCCSP